MSDKFNSYHEWLELDPNLSQPDYYQLLRLDPFETDAATIKAAADRATAKVRGARPGQRAAQWARLLDELTEAKNTLLDSARKSEYDASLRNSQGGAAQVAASSSQQIASTGDQSQPSGSGVNPMYPPGMGDNVAAPASQQPIASPAASAVPAKSTQTSQPTSPSVADPMQPYSAGSPSTATSAQDPMAPYSAGGGYAGSPNVPAGHAQPHAPIAAPAGDPMSPMSPYAAPSGPNAYDPMAPVTPAPSAPASPQAGTSYANGVSGDAAYDAIVLPTGPSPDPMAPAYGAPSAAAATPSFGAAPTGSAPVAMPAQGLRGEVPMGIVQPSSNAASPAYAVPHAQPAHQPATPAFKGGGQSAVDMAAERQSSSRQTLIIVGVALTLFLLFSAVGYYVVSQMGFLGGDTVAELPNDDGVVNPIPPNSNPPQTNGTPTPTPFVPTPKNPPVIETPPITEPGPMPTPVPTPMPMPVPTPTPPPEPTPMPTPEPPMPTPQPAPMPTPEPPPMPTPQELAALGTALNEAKYALMDKRLDDADKTLADAESLAKLPEHKDMVTRAKLVAAYIREFWKAVADGVQQLDALDELKYKDNVIVIVEVQPDLLVFRYEGATQRRPINHLPDGLAILVADKVLDPNAASTRLLKGALYAVNVEKDPEYATKARRYWEEATAMGGEGRQLIPYLDDNYELAKK